MGKNFYVETKVKDYLHSRSCNLSSDATGDPLNKVIRETLDTACGRAKANNRKTVFERDL